MRYFKVNAHSSGVLLRLLAEGTRTMPELAEETGLHIQTVRAYCKEWHRQKVLHICSYDQDSMGRYTHKVFMLGAGKDVSPQRLTRKQVCERYRQGKKAKALAALLSLAAISD